MDDFVFEMELAGCVQLYHPDEPGCFYVVEQKLKEDGKFRPKEQGAYIFQILPNQPYATQSSCPTFASVWTFVKKKIENGWEYLDMDDLYVMIPKKKFVKWQLCRQVF